MGGRTGGAGIGSFLTKRGRQGGGGARPANGPLPHLAFHPVVHGRRHVVPVRHSGRGSQMASSRYVGAILVMGAAIPHWCPSEGIDSEAPITLIRRQIRCWKKLCTCCLAFGVIRLLPQPLQMLQQSIPAVVFRGRSHTLGLGLRAKIATAGQSFTGSMRDMRVLPLETTCLTSLDHPTRRPAIGAPVSLLQPWAIGSSGVAAVDVTAELTGRHTTVQPAHQLTRLRRLARFLLARRQLFLCVNSCD